MTGALCRAFVAARNDAVLSVVLGVALVGGGDVERTIGNVVADYRIRVEHRPRVGPRREVAEGVIPVRRVDCVPLPRLEAQWMEPVEFERGQVQRGESIVLLANDNESIVVHEGDELGLQRLRQGRALEGDHRHVDARSSSLGCFRVESLEADEGGGHTRGAARGAGRGGGWQWGAGWWRSHQWGCSGDGEGGGLGGGAGCEGWAGRGI